MSRPQPAQLLLATRKNLDYCKPVARRPATKKAWLGGPKFGPQNWAPNLDPIFGPQTLPQLGHCLEKKDRNPFSGPCLGSENGANFADKLGSEFEKKGSEEKAGKPAANCQHISSRSLGKRAAEKIKATTFHCGWNPHELFTTLWSNRLQLLS